MECVSASASISLSSTRGMQLPGAKRATPSSPSQELRSARRTKLSRLLRKVKRYSGQNGVRNWKCSGVDECGGSVSIELTANFSKKVELQFLSND